MNSLRNHLIRRSLGLVVLATVMAFSMVPLTPSAVASQQRQGVAATTPTPDRLGIADERATSDLGQHADTTSDGTTGGESPETVIISDQPSSIAVPGEGSTLGEPSPSPTVPVQVAGQALIQEADQPVQAAVTDCTPGPNKNLAGCVFNNQNLAGVSFSGSNINSATFNGANLSGTNFSGALAGETAATFDGANLTCANFTNAVLIGATFNGANLSGADFTGADLTSATFSATTRCPDGALAGGDTSCGGQFAPNRSFCVAAATATTAAAAT
ncbi:MAG: pentapeptide repeat-containing protein, partial [Chloroflexota bacterium]|nr:pentapeptide repeat-containing protein [Chloroflexota bacterium]